VKAPYRLEDTAEGLRAIIPASEEYPVLCILGAVWAVWFLLGACFFDEIAREIFLYSKGRSNASEVIFLAAATLVLAPKGLRAFSIWGWSVYGEETLALGAVTLSLVRSVVGMRRTSTFRIGEVRKLRVVSVPHPLDMIWPLAPPGTRPARCAAVFESEGGQTRFAEGLERTQAETLIKHLISRCPGLAGS
jgi:hypothetical protein